ncbi:MULTISPECIES: class I SAM-dependent methyltransferase [unclassified Nocardiopsis]|uniref:class I SAM-dependent methyltransferase n=1 Tax=Nocardiopsis TaxID=2013 RepID=UPI00387A8CAD
MSTPDYLRAVRESYDTVAADYAAAVRSPAELDPVSRAMLGAFAELARTAPGPVADLGCGPGKVAAHLAAAGVPVFGVDLSPGMVAQARGAHPDLGFAVGSMTALPLGDGVLGGILAYYAVHHTPPEVLPRVFAEFRRTLAPGGHVMVAGYVGDGETVPPARVYGGHEVSYKLHLLPPERIAALMAAAGLTVTARMVQEPPPGGRRRSATLLARG